MSTARQSIMLLTVGLVALCGSAQGHDLYFTNQAPAGASWFTAENWRTTNSPSIQRVPTLADNAWIDGANGSCTAIVDGPGGVAGSRLYFGTATSTSNQTNLKIVPGAELYVQGWCMMGYRTSAKLEITGGVFSGLERLYVGYNPLGTNTEAEIVQYAGDVILTNGSAPSIFLNSYGARYASGYPRYRLVDGYVQAAYWYVGGAGYGKLEVEGGTNYLVNRLRVGYDPGGEGVCLQSGGDVSTYSLELGYSGANGRYELSGGYFHNRFEPLYCGFGGEGTFIQTGGTNDAVTKHGLYIGTKPTGTGYYQISGGKIDVLKHLLISTNGTLSIIGGDPEITCASFTLHEYATLNVNLTNGIVSPVAVRGSSATKLHGTLNVTLQGPPESYPDRSTVVTIMTYPNGTSGTEFDTINLAPADQLLGVRVNYNTKSITLDQWEYPPRGTVLIVR